MYTYSMYQSIAFCIIYKYEHSCFFSIAVCCHVWLPEVALKACCFVSRKVARLNTSSFPPRGHCSAQTSMRTWAGQVRECRPVSRQRLGSSDQSMDLWKRGKPWRYYRDLRRQPRQSGHIRTSPWGPWGCGHMNSPRKCWVLELQAMATRSSHPSSTPAWDLHWFLWANRRALLAKASLISAAGLGLGWPLFLDVPRDATVNGCSALQVTFAPCHTLSTHG